MGRKTRALRTAGVMFPSHHPRLVSAFSEYAEVSGHVRMHPEDIFDLFTL